MSSGRSEDGAWPIHAEELAKIGAALLAWQLLFGFVLVIVDVARGLVAASTSPLPGDLLFLCPAALDQIPVLHDHLSSNHEPQEGKQANDPEEDALGPLADWVAESDDGCQH